MPQTYVRGRDVPRVANPSLSTCHPEAAKRPQGSPPHPRMRSFRRFATQDDKGGVSVCKETLDARPLQPIQPGEKAQRDEEREAGDRRAEPLDEPTCGQGSAAGGDDVVDDEDL